MSMANNNYYIKKYDKLKGRPGVTVVVYGSTRSSRSSDLLARDVPFARFEISTR